MAEGGDSWVRLSVVGLVHLREKAYGACYRACLYGAEGRLVAGNRLLEGNAFAFLRHEQKRGNLGDRNMGNNNYESMGGGVCYARMREETAWSRSMAQSNANRR